MKAFALILFCCALGVIPSVVSGQGTVDPSGTSTNGSSNNSITTAVPFLTISPDSRSGAMGDAGVALSPDVNANYWNPSKLAFIEGRDNISLSYSPWLRNLVSGINLAYLSYSRKIDERNALGLSLRYFNLGSIQLIDINQANQGTYQPNEFSIDGSFSRKFGQNFSLGLTLRYIHSNLSNGGFSSGQQVKAANAAAADVSAFYRLPGQQFGHDAMFAAGLNISNLGTKLGYVSGGTQYFLPANLRLGAANTWFVDNLNQVTVALDVNKLLVPTPPFRDNKGNIVQGYDDDKSVPAGIFSSFVDAPDGLREELKEINIGGGVEYGYNRQLFLRAGYFYESPAKGNRQYLTVGAGFKYDRFNLDLSYLVAAQQKSPLANTLRFTVSVNLERQEK